jgi:hypothetical protein
MFNQTKVIISGDMLEAFYYKKRFDFREFNLEQNKVFSLWRSRSTLKRIINCNAGKWYDEKNKKYYLPQFFTPTFVHNIKNINDANNEFSLFIKRVNYEIFKTKKSTLKYSTVIEFQKRGAIHYHSIFYNLPYIEHHIQTMTKIWSWGNVHMASVYDVGDIGNYLTKYMVKGFDDDRLFGKKRYFNSRGLNKPIVYTEEYGPKVFDLLEQIPQKLAFTEFITDEMVYRAWWLLDKRMPNIIFPEIEKSVVMEKKCSGESYPQSLF